MLWEPIWDVGSRPLKFSGHTLLRAEHRRLAVPTQNAIVGRSFGTELPGDSTLVDIAPETTAMSSTAVDPSMGIGDFHIDAKASP
mmetsp:Transcript_15154/g.35751  ORF Transcript_15154/g.35751 Transcript_15154/m.35751 type:complete len:85 (+) Transcript_15154:809-1063(+)